MILSPDYQLIVTKPSKNFYFVVQPPADKQVTSKIIPFLLNKFILISNCFIIYGICVLEFA